VEMVRQNHDRVDFERMIVTRLSESFPQTVDMSDELVVIPSLGKIHGKKIFSTADTKTFIGSHFQLDGFGDLNFK
jgi:hypothetical protein